MEPIARDDHPGPAPAGVAASLQLRLMRAHTAEDVVNQTNAFLASGCLIVSVSHLHVAEGSWFVTVVYRTDRDDGSAVATAEARKDRSR